MSTDHYLQFPLCALAYGKDVSEKLNAIIHYAVVQAGYKVLERLSTEERRQRINAWKSEGNLPAYINWSNTPHLAAMCGTRLTGIVYHRMDSLIEMYRGIENFINGFKSRHGGDPFVRIKTDWLIDARDGKGISYREFSLLCAIYSSIGDKDHPVRITREAIRRRALGYKAASVMSAELPGRKDGIAPLTERQLRDTLGRLHRNRFFARCTVCRRCTYYSHRLDDKELREAVLKRYTYARIFRSRQAALDRELTAAIRCKLAKATLGNPHSAVPSAKPMARDAATVAKVRAMSRNKSKPGPKRGPKADLMPSSQRPL